jgi:hypothetical protein
MDAYKLRSINEATSSLSGNAFPGQVFSRDDLEYRFFEADRLFSPSFVKIAVELLQIGNSKSACLVNISELRRSGSGEPPAIFFERSMTEQQYSEQLKRGGPARGWLFGVDHFVAAPDAGGWVIYCEKENDMAVAAFPKGRFGVKLYSDPLVELSAESIETILADEENALVPFNNLKENWRIGLLKNYSN